MKAKLVLHSKQIKGDEIVEIKIWQLPEIADKTQHINFSIVYIKDGKRLIGYDNAEGKGYHRHYGLKEEAYHFKTIWGLLDDFKNDLKHLRGRDWDED
jgi:hypothetical protein